MSYLTFELAFQSYFETAVKELVKDCFDGAERKALSELICASFDVKLISAIERTLRSYKDVLPLSEVPLQTMVTMTRFSPKEIAAFTKFDSADSFLRSLQTSCYKNWFSFASPRSLEQQLSASLTALCKKQIRYPVYPGVVMFCYLQLSAVEAKNLLRVIEGVKFHVPPQVIAQNLILEPTN